MAMLGDNRMLPKKELPALEGDQKMLPTGSDFRLSQTGGAGVWLAKGFHLYS